MSMAENGSKTKLGPAREGGETEGGEDAGGRQKWGKKLTVTLAL
jgi:hypothetical protein